MSDILDVINASLNNASDVEVLGLVGTRADEEALRNGVCCTISEKSLGNGGLDHVEDEIKITITVFDESENVHEIETYKTLLKGTDKVQVFQFSDEVEKLLNTYSHKLVMKNRDERHVLYCKSDEYASLAASEFMARNSGG
jgi:hypothetical protein